jgi:hypothetical protein
MYHIGLCGEIRRGKIVGGQSLFPNMGYDVLLKQLLAPFVSEEVGSKTTITTLINRKDDFFHKYVLFNEP